MNSVPDTPHFLKKALILGAENGDLYAAYQPIVSTIDGRVLGVEALLRWDRGSGESINIEPLIDKVEAEDSLSDFVGEFMLHKACADLSMAIRSGLCDKDTYVSINVSGRQLGRDQLRPLVESTLAETGLILDNIVLEVTERVVLGEVQIAELLALKRWGVRLAIDDFGTGNTSIVLLGGFPSIVKIDKSFVTGVPHDRQAARLMEILVSLGAVYNLSVCAEGVENEEQVRFLTKSGCNSLQGYWFARPTTMEASLRM